SNFINNPNFLNQLLEKSWFIISSSIVTQGTLLGFCFLLCKIRHVDFIKAASINKKISLLVILILPVLSLFLLASDIPLLSAVDDIFRIIGYNEPDILTENLLSTPLGIIGVIISTCILPAICEEFVFRGIVLQGLASRFKPFTAILLSAFAFCMMHMSPAQTAHQFVLGVALGYIVLTTGSIWPGVILHFSNNFWAVLASIVSLNGLESALLNNTIFIYVGAVVFTLLGLAAFFLAFDFVAKKQKDSIFINAITGFKKHKQGNRFKMNYDVIVPPIKRVFNPEQNAFVETPLSEEEYSLFAATKEQKNRRKFIIIYCIAFGICIAVWLFALKSALVGVLM
ncbi:MAG TPA: CPBP family intramembrane glutamic endopeptidase, partial [Clostridia bacterium]